MGRIFGQGYAILRFDRFAIIAVVVASAAFAIAICIVVVRLKI